MYDRLTLDKKASRIRVNTRILDAFLAGERRQSIPSINWFKIEISMKNQVNRYCIFNFFAILKGEFKIIDGIYKI